MTRTLTIIASSLALIACGGEAEQRSGGEPATARPTTQQTAGAEESDILPTAWDGKPLVTVRVDGPDAVALRPDQTPRVGATRYEAVVRMHNEGDRPAELELAHVDFEAWSEDGERLACVPIAESTLDAPPLLHPNEMHELRAEAVCHFPEPGEYEVRAYVSFGAEARGSDFELARYYAGRTSVQVAGG